MANDFERRLSKLEKNFDEHLTVIYTFIDELRSFTRQLKNEHEESVVRIAQNEDQLRRLVDSQATLAGTMFKLSESQDRLIETQGATIKILRGMEARLDNHEGRLSAASI